MTIGYEFCSFEFEQKDTNDNFAEVDLPKTKVKSCSGQSFQWMSFEFFAEV